MRRCFFPAIAQILFLLFSVNAFAATYYVKNDGNDNLDGRSEATAWRTIGKVNKYKFATGDDLYFKCGGKWTGTGLTIDWNGTAGNRSVIGAYHMHEGLEKLGVHGNKPVIVGRPWTDPNPVPSNEWKGLISVIERDYVTVENIRVVNSGGEGIEIYGAIEGIIQNCNIECTYQAGIAFGVNVGGKVRNNDVTDTGRIAVDNPGNNWPAALSCSNGSSNVTIERNTIHENWGEGIGLYNNSHDCIVQDNVCYANRKCNGIYIEKGQGHTIRRNLIYGTKDPTYWRPVDGPDLPAQGIWIDHESQRDASPSNSDIMIYNNIIAWCNTGIRLASSHPSGFIDKVAVYNNTVVDCRGCISFEGPFSESKIKNNIFYCITNTGDHPCTLYSGNSRTPGLTWDYNLWSGPVSGDLDGANDPLPAAGALTKISGWRSMSGGDLKASHFALQATSPAIDNGLQLGKDFAFIPECNVSIWPGRVVLMNQKDQGSGWEIGADIHVVNPETPSPNNLIIKNHNN